MDDIKVPAYPKTPHKGKYARIKLAGRDVQLGIWGSAESRELYRRAVVEHLAGGGRRRMGAVPTVGAVVAAWRDYMAATYRKRSRPTSHGRNARAATEAVLDLYAGLPARDFAPAGLKAVRSAWVRRGVCRTVANKYARLVVRCWRWAAGEGLVPGECWSALHAVEPLARGRSAARESGSVPPLGDADFEATAAMASPTIAAMLRVQRLTGMRPGEVCGMRAGDVRPVAGGPGWAYVVPDDWNKEAHAGKVRVVALGPRARAILGPLLEGLAPGDHVFRPRSAGLRRAGPRYTTGTYYNRVAVAARRAGLRPWGLNRLRHSAATAVEAATGDRDGVRAMLGHGRERTTGIYVTPDARAIRDFKAAAAVAEAMG